jgi:hypothetical protein
MEIRRRPQIIAAARLYPSIIRHCAIARVEYKM